MKFKLAIKLDKHPLTPKEFIFFNLWYNKNLKWGGLTLFNVVIFNFGPTKPFVW
jgi:hypothetical protein